MTIVNSTLRPGLLVSLKTALVGNITYTKRIIEPEHVTEDGVEKARWETVRTITDRAEHDRGRKAQAEARSVITRVCTNTAFGLLCPEAEKDNLERAVNEARAIAERFNESAALSRMSVYVLTGRVAPDDVEAVKSINAEVRALMKEMEDGVANLDVAAIRAAANEAKRLGAMLSTEAAGRVQVAVEAARAAARKIVKAGEQAAQEVDRAAISRLVECRTSFLDLDGYREVATPEAEARGVDLMPVEAPATETTVAPGPSRQIELEDVINENGGGNS